MNCPKRALDWTVTLRNEPFNKIYIVKLWSLIIGFACTAVAAHATDYTLYASADGKTKAVLTTSNVSLSTSTLQTGTGTLVLTVAGHALPAIGPVSFNDLKTSAQAILGATFTMPSTGTPPTLPNFDASGFDLIVQIGSSIKYTAASGSTPASLSLKGGSYLSTPFKDVSGSPIQAKFDTLSISSDGSIASTGTITVVKPIELPIVSIISGSVNFDFAATPNAPATFKGSAPDVVIGLAIPAIATNEDKPITMEAQNIAFDIDGNVTFDHAFFPPTSAAAKQVITGSTINVSFADPAGFDLKLTSGDVTMDSKNPNVFKSAEFKGSLTLPVAFSSTDPATGNATPVELQSFDAKVVSGGQTTITASTNEINLYWNTFRLQIPAATGSPNLTLNFGGPKKSVAISKAKLYLPAAFGSANNTVDVSNFSLDSGGLSGQFDADTGLTLGVPGFAVGKLTGLSLTFLKSHLTDFNATGTISLPNLGGDIGIQVGCSDSGLTTISVDQPNPIPLKMFGMQLAITQGTVNIDPGGKSSLKLTGSLSVSGSFSGDLGPMNYLSGAEFAFKDLTINSDGTLALTSAYMDLPTPAKVSIGPVDLELNQIGFGIDQGSSNPWITLTGDVAITDLPISGQIGFDGLKITAGPNGPAKIDLGGIFLSTGIQGVVSIQASLDHKTFPDMSNADDKAAVNANPIWKQNSGKTLDVYRGSAAISLDCLGGGGSIEDAAGPTQSNSGNVGSATGGGLKFMVSQTGWYVLGTVSIGNMAGQGIQLGQTPFALYGFAGGIGHNVLSSNGSFQGVPTVDYQLIPYPPGVNVPNNWLITAGVRLGTSDAMTAWGDLVLSILFGNGLYVDLSGRLVLMQPMSDSTFGPMLTSLAGADRLVSGDLYYDGPNSTFKADLTADLYFPTKALYQANPHPGLHLKGGLDLLLSPQAKHLYIGGPITDPDPSQPPVIQNPVSVEVFGIQGPTAALTVDFNDINHLMAAGAAEFSFTRSFNGSVGPVSWDAGVNINAWVYAKGELHPPNFRLDGGVGVNGSADVTVHVPVFGDFSAGVGAGGYLVGYIDTASNPHAGFTGDVYANVHVCHFSHTIDLSVTVP